MSYPIRHNIPVLLVFEQTLRALKKEAQWHARRNEEQRALIQRYESDPRKHLWLHKPEMPSPEYHQRRLNELRHQGAHVRVLEIEKDKFILSYSEINDKYITSGTGPFDTFEKAQRWFLNGGR